MPKGGRGKPREQARQLLVSKGARGVELAAARKRRRRGGVEGRKRTSLKKKFFK
jgi:hypothetical protein